jgi:hypothetical protein
LFGLSGQVINLLGELSVCFGILQLAALLLELVELQVRTIKYSLIVASGCNSRSAKIFRKCRLMLGTVV